MVFCAGHGTGVFDGREELKAVARRVRRSPGGRAGAGAVRGDDVEPAHERAVVLLPVGGRRGACGAVPFSYAQAQVRTATWRGTAQVNLARRRTPKRHVTIRYLEADFAELFVAALGGLGPDGMPDSGYRGRELARNSAVGRLALASGLRRQEFSYLLVYEVPPLPSSPGRLPVPFPVPAGVTKGRKYRTTWIDYAPWRRCTSMPGWTGPRRGRVVVAAAAASGASRCMVSEADAAGGRVNGRRVRWEQAAARRSGGGWSARRAGRACWRSAPTAGRSPRGRACSPGPRTGSGSVSSRGSRMSTRTGCGTLSLWPRWRRLVGGYYAQAAGLVTATGTGDGPDAALALYLAKADPMMVLRDLLGHSSRGDHGSLPAPPGHDPYLRRRLRAGGPRCTG